MKLRNIKGRKLNLTNLTRLKIRGCLFIRGISLLLIPFFLLSNLTFAQTFQAENSTLARYSFAQIATLQDSTEFREAVERYMPLWLTKIEQKMEESKDEITLPYLVLELTKQIEHNAKEVNLPRDKIDEIIDILIEKAALKWEEVETGEEEVIDSKKRKHVAANLKDLKKDIAEKEKQEKVIDILTRYAQREDKNEADIIDTRLKLARLKNVPQERVRSYLLALQSGTIPAEGEAEKPETREELTRTTKLVADETLIWHDKHGVGVYRSGNMKRENSEIVVRFWGPVGEKCFRVSSLKMDLVKLFLATAKDVEQAIKSMDEAAAKFETVRKASIDTIPIIKKRLSILKHVLRGDPNKVFVPTALMEDFELASKYKPKIRYKDIIHIRRKSLIKINIFLKLQKQRNEGHYTLENSSKVERLILGTFFKKERNYTFFYSKNRSNYQARMLEYLRKNSDFIRERMKKILNAEGRISDDTINEVIKNTISAKASRSKVVPKWIKWLKLPEEEGLRHIEKWIRDAIPRVEVMLAKEFPKLGIKPRLGESTPTPQTVIPQIEYLTKHAIEAHKLLRPEGPIDLSKIAIVMQKDLTDGFIAGKGAILNETLQQEYQRMKQGLRKHFPNSKEIEAKDKAELPNIVNSLIGRGLKVVILDDGTLTKHLRSSDLQGKAAEDYCVIRAQYLKDIDGTTIQFLNLNAMALLGVAVLYSDLILYETAHKLFTGSELSEIEKVIIIAGIKSRTMWSFPALPRIIKFTGTIQDRKELQRLFSVSA